MAALFASDGSSGAACEQRLVARVRFAEPAAAPGLHGERARRERILRLRRREPGEIDRLREAERRGDRRVQRGIGSEGEQRRAGEPRDGIGARDHAGGREREHDALARPAVDDADRQQRERETEQALAEQRQREHEAAQEGDAREGGHLARDRVAEVVGRVRRREEPRRRDAQQAAGDEPYRRDRSAPSPRTRARPRDAGGSRRAPRAPRAAHRPATRRGARAPARAASGPPAGPAPAAPPPRRARSPPRGTPSRAGSGRRNRSSRRPSRRRCGGCARPVPRASSPARTRLDRARSRPRRPAAGAEGQLGLGSSAYRLGLVRHRRGRRQARRKPENGHAERPAAARSHTHPLRRSTGPACVSAGGGQA